MVLIRTLLLGLLLVAFGSPPAVAHEKHRQEKSAVPTPAVAPGTPMPPSEMQERMEAHAEEMEAERPKTFPERLVSWFGRMHPFAVHFPIALFPVALVALILARRRGETIELIRALIVVAGAGSVLGALLGWLNGGLTVNDTDLVLQLHRWLGTFLGFAGGGIALWAWRGRASATSGLMVAALAVTVALLLVQGFLGASVTHGMEHMMF